MNFPSHPRNRTGCLTLAVMLMPGICFANGWISGVNAFRQTPEFYFIFSAIVVVETVVLWLWLRPIPWPAVLWRAVVLNAVSSLAGDVLFRLDWTPSSGYLWKQAIPFFLLTVALECPLTRPLFGRALRSRQRTLLVSLSANIASYALLMAIDRPVREAWLASLRAQDRQVLARWTNTQMLAEAPGCIYTPELSLGRPHRLKRFDFADRQWHSISNSPAVDPNIWHIEGDLLAYLPDDDPPSRGLVRLTTLPDCATVRELPLPPTSHRDRFDWDLALSPDGTKLAVLVPLHAIQGPLSELSYQTLGITCLLTVFNLATGEAVVCPRKASRTLHWLPDSRAVLFHSLRDEALHELKTLPADWRKTFDPTEPDDPFAAPRLFAFYPGTGVVEPLADAPSGFLGGGANRLIFQSKSDTVELLDLASHSRSRVTLGRVGLSGRIAVSPDGRLALVPLVLNPPANYWGYPTIVDLNDPSRRYHFGPTLYRVVWARTVARRN